MCKCFCESPGTHRSRPLSPAVSGAQIPSTPWITGATTHSWKGWVFHTLIDMILVERLEPQQQSVLSYTATEAPTNIWEIISISLKYLVPLWRKPKNTSALANGWQSTWSRPDHQMSKNPQKWMHSPTAVRRWTRAIQGTAGWTLPTPAALTLPLVLGVPFCNKRQEAHRPTTPLFLSRLFLSPMIFLQSLWFFSTTEPNNSVRFSYKTFSLKPTNRLLSTQLDSYLIHDSPISTQEGPSTTSAAERRRKKQEKRRNYNN